MTHGKKHVEMGNIKVVINKKYEHLRPLIAAVPEKIAASEGSVIYRGRNTIVRMDVGGLDLAVKSFRIPILPNRIAYSWFRTGKARRSFENAEELGRLGIDTPEPIAYIEEYRFGLLRHSYYICKMEEDARDIRLWQQIPDNEPLLRALAAFMVELHKKGVYHRDFSPGNILYRRLEDGSYRFMLIDINRMSFGVHDPELLYRNFRCIYLESEEETMRIARYYAEAAGLNATEMAERALRLLRAYHKAKDRHRRWKRFFHLEG